jgi:hypothetical protein
MGRAVSSVVVLNPVISSVVAMNPVTSSVVGMLSFTGSVIAVSKVSSCLVTYTNPIISMLTLIIEFTINTIFIMSEIVHTAVGIMSPVGSIMSSVGSMIDILSPVGNIMIAIESMFAHNLLTISTIVL